jgi:hypothetical protein
MALAKINVLIEELNDLSSKYEDINCTEKIEAFRNVIFIKKKQLTLTIILILNSKMSNFY